MAGLPASVDIPHSPHSLPGPSYPEPFLNTPHTPTIRHESWVLNSHLEDPRQKLKDQDDPKSLTETAA